ncbi:glycoside hydrolase family 16 protein [Actinoplanes sp. RD1]|uniref:glycoside hydrolase family 16 protein n=1 Tax=Actinoplanes sp. RD1 TaxID=3064538 RepID=UPI002741BED3|nr:glycoside hydrolase family 16 protein [Actinoplanes sp. RD1]
MAVSGHVVADYAYSQPGSNGVNPEMYLPQKDVSPGEVWTFAMDTWVSGSASAPTVAMQVDWYNASSGYLGHTEGAQVPVAASSAEQWTRVAGEFTAPAGAARANVTAQLTAPAGMTWRSTACDYRPVGTGTPPPAQTDTAAGAFGWGTPLPESDEFNYGSAAAPAAPDPSKWNSAGTGPNTCYAGHNGNGLRCEANTRVLGTYARMTGEANGETGWLGSKREQKYGRWEVRARSQATGAASSRQYHPMLITWPANNQWPQGAEYDFLENSAPGEDCAGAFLHYPNHQPKTQEQAGKCGVDLTQWHNFGFEWSPQGLTGYIDGVQWFSFSSDCIQCAPGPMYQTIQLDNFFGGNLQPAVFDIDWARVYAI